MNRTFALVGNPNVGKTSVFNRLTHSSERVGNWHGVTVDKVAKVTKHNSEIEIVDLPGIYSLTAYSMEETVSRDEILSKGYDLIIYICEANNLARNLYLALQLIELDVPFVIVVNMMDELFAKGMNIDAKLLSDRLEVPVTCLSAKNGFDADRLMIEVTEYAEQFTSNKLKLPYIQKLPIWQMREIISNTQNKSSDNELLYYFIKALEGDDYSLNKLSVSQNQRKSITALGNYKEQIAALRYEFIDKITEEVVVTENTKKFKFSTINNKLDKLLLNKYLALPIFLLIMSGIFGITFGLVGKYCTQILTIGKDYLIELLNGVLKGTALLPWMNSLLLYGIIDGACSVLVFLPQIVTLFFFLALLEDSGYISRVAFMTDGIFRKIGLSGRAVFTILTGLGCSASAVTTARGLEDDNTRKKAVMLTPFISCSARLPVYVAISAAFFVERSALIIFGLYLLGISILVLIAAIFQKTKLRSGDGPFIMEMPQYRFPTYERVAQIILSNAKNFVVKVGTVILCFNVIIWVLCNFSFTNGFVEIGEGLSIMEKISGIIAPIFKPLGFGSWKAVTALMSGLIAKEAVISTIVNLGGAQSVFFDQLSALCFMVFTLLYVPCVATIASTYREIGIKWTVFSIVMQLIVAYLTALAVRIVVLAFKNGIFYGLIALAFCIAVVVSFTMVLSIMTKNKRRVRCFSGCNNCNDIQNCCK